MKEPDKKHEVEHVAREAGLDMNERVEFLRELFPEAIAEGKVDWDKLRTALGDAVDGKAERYSFSWAGKRDAIRLLQMPSRATLNPAPDESVDWDTTKNAFIEGDNLEVLKLLLKPYYGRVKMIYIDPPYNTGNDFVYPDNYADPLETYLKLSGQKDTDGNLLTTNADTSGRYHSAWLSMMYPRLFMARQLLDDDGAIFISMDDSEITNLRMAMNEVFGEENFVATIVWQKKYSPQNDAKYFSDMHDYIVIYAKSKERWRPTALARTPEQDAAYSNPDNDTRGPWKATDATCNKSKAQRPNLYYPITNPNTGEAILPLETRVWRYARSVHEKKQQDNRVWWGADGKNKVPAYKSFLSEVKQGRVPTTWWPYQEAGHNQSARQTLNALIEENPFDTPKPVELMKKLLEVGLESEDAIVLDFFAGSGTMAQAVLEFNRANQTNHRFLLVQLQEPLKSPRTFKGKRLLSTISDLCVERIRVVIEKLRAEKQDKLKLAERFEPEDLGLRVYKLAESNYKPWAGVADNDPDKYVAELEMFADPLKDKWQPESVMYEVAVKEGYGLSLSIAKVDGVKKNEVFRITDADKGQSFLICLDNKLDQQTPRELELKKDDLLVCRDIALTDELAANLALQCRLKTV